MDYQKILIRAYGFIINKVKRSLYILLEKDDKIPSKYCIFGLTFQSPFSKYTVFIGNFVIFSTKMYKLLFTLFIIIKRVL